MRYFLYLLLYIPAQLFAYLITPLLPMFAVDRYGPIDNASRAGVEPRLPSWLAWFMTPDNSLHGDGNWQSSHDGRYGSQVLWLYRNSLYGFKWTVLSRPIQATRVIRGNPQIDYHQRRFGTLRITQPNGAWQYKAVSPFLGKIIVLNFGWLLDDPSQEKALFMFSPRIK